jgi:hypothetical protein
MDWFEKLGETLAVKTLPGVSPDAKVVPVVFVTLVDVDDIVSFLGGGEEDRLCRRRVEDAGLSVVFGPDRLSSACSGASDRLGAGWSILW